MSDTVCNRTELIAGSAPFAGFNDHEILALTIMLKAEIAHAANPDIPTDVASLEAAAEGLTTNAGFYKRRRMDARLYLRCLEAVGAGAETDCGDVSALWNKAKCFSCKSDDELEAIRLYLTCAMQIPVAPPFPEGATHYWRLNEASGDSVDEIGGLTLVRGAGVTTVAGPLDGALEVNNAVAGWYLTTAAVPPLLKNDGATLSFWFKSAVNPNGFAVMVQITGGSSVDEVFEFNPDGPGDSKLYLYDGLGGYQACSLGTLAQTSDGNWHHWVFVVADDGSDVSLYIDGVLITSVALTTTVSAANHEFSVGQSYSNNPATPIAVADLGIWPRALTQEEITTLYNGGVPLRP